ncbi:hypothetical protein BX616_007812 [Lobosporangium transversale]|uniref:Arrestin-like N-terminal domain-containing protein n=1 Tax=Lobosporangium transversale TaxID=64571 RepID=A0A1Y2GBM5_9FUNG|nr:hypothetical protein BCR41DRAFT_389284 [Lobosporangium transversale]KAF9914666.1 hypothetical protein BX616_007812 [Lobosporangium transversale]ORZ06375.1 hypothetical protein BCR41DRAFT_389284 [Lobosporangium transversale]|eukprot:XP_021877538.1 hypothetical protein BCR41DRAFT_389284 [Lobosporangium transversale]
MDVLNKLAGVKKLAINVNSPTRLGPKGEPLLYGTPEQPAVISGEVVFESDSAFKGQDLTVEVTMMNTSGWTDIAGYHHFPYRSCSVFGKKSISVGLRYSSPGTIQAGKYRATFNVPVNITAPSSMTNEKSWMTYKVTARIPRSLPNADIVEEREVWVINSNISSGQRQGEKLIPCLVYETGDELEPSETLDNPKEEAEEPMPKWIEKLHNFSLFSKKEKVKGPFAPSSAGGLYYTFEVPTTTFIAGETFPIALEALPLISKEDSSPATATSSFGGSPLPTQIDIPKIRVRLEQKMFYWHDNGTAKFPEPREFGCDFPASLITGGDEMKNGWRLLLNATLPRLGAKEVKVEGRLGEENATDGLKPSVRCRSLTIRHNLCVDLIFKDLVRKFKIPITITGPAGSEPVPSRFISDSRWVCTTRPGLLEDKLLTETVVRRIDGIFTAITRTDRGV